MPASIVPLRKNMPIKKKQKVNHLLGANGDQHYIVNPDVRALPPETINQRQLRDIKHALETPIESDEDLKELGREFDE